MTGEVRHKNLVGLKFGKLAVIAKMGKTTNNSILWECECECSRRIKVVTADLNRGKAKSCGVCVKRATTNGKVNNGDVFGRWTIVEANYACREGNAYSLCECSCGNKKEVLTSRLVKGTSMSCGCLQKEKIANRSTIHGDYLTRLYRIWSGMRQRCINPNTNSFKNYGGRGIKVCEEWEDYLAFKRWALNNGYSDSLTIERKDVNGNYAPDNVIFVSSFDQHSNRRDNVFITYGDTFYTIAQLSRKVNIPASTLGKWYKKSNATIERLIKERIENDSNF